jgi:hypothetical protein
MCGSAARFSGRAGDARRGGGQPVAVTRPRRRGPGAVKFLEILGTRFSCFLSDFKRLRAKGSAVGRLGGFRGGRESPSIRPAWTAGRSRASVWTAGMAEVKPFFCKRKTGGVGACSISAGRTQPISRRPCRQGRTRASRSSRLRRSLRAKTRSAKLEPRARPRPFAAATSRFGNIRKFISRPFEGIQRVAAKRKPARGLCGAPRRPAPRPRRPRTRSSSLAADSAHLHPRGARSMMRRRRD